MLSDSKSAWHLASLILHWLLNTAALEKAHGLEQASCCNIGKVLHRCITKATHDTGNLSIAQHNSDLQSTTDIISTVYQHIADECRGRLPPRAGLADSAATHNECKLMLAQPKCARYPNHCFQRVLLIDHPLQMAPL